MPASHIRVLVLGLATLFLIQLSTKALGKAADDGPLLEHLPPKWEIKMGFFAPGFSLAQIWLLHPFGRMNQWMEDFSLFFVTLPFKKINKPLKIYREISH